MITSINYYGYFQDDKFLYIVFTTILILYRKLHINVVSIIVLNIEARQCNIKINLAISCSPTISCLYPLLTWREKEEEDDNTAIDALNYN